jgi:hypothetical protein
LIVIPRKMVVRFLEKIRILPKNPAREWDLSFG